MYLYLTDKGETTGPQKLSNHQYFVKVGELINRLIGQNTQDGFVFRVDLRLRPEGERGDLVQSLAGYELYYESWGQTWERSALLKARPCAGDMELGRAFLETIRPFVFRKYLDYSAISEIRDMKQRVEKNALAHGQDLIDLKLGAGGIREIEFFISVLQLIYGAREQGIREKSSLKALHRLALKNLISFEEQQDLAKAYEFLRTAEHRLQVVDERQTHSLNNTMGEVQPLALRMGFRDKDGLPAGEAFLAVLARHNNRVRQIYDGLLSEQAVDVIDTDGGFSPLFEIDVPEDECVSLLGMKGFNDPRQSYINFLLLRDGSPGSPLTPRSRGLFIKIIPALLDGCAQSPDPDMALARLESFVAAFGSREAIYDFISAQPEAAHRVTRLLGWSDYFSRLLITYPELSDSLLFAGDEALRKPRDEMSGELEKELAKFTTLADKMDILRKYKHAEELRIGINDILNDPGTKTTSHALTTLAEVVLEKTLLLAAEDTDSKYGKPPGFNNSSGIAVAGFGKLGSGELGYGSDLDIIFIYRGSEAGGKTKGIGLTEYYTRLSERAIFILTSLTREGFLFRVDTRLRPGGTKGVLAHNIESLREYYMKKASVWELQALTRARGVAGDGHLISTFEKMREDILMTPKDTGTVKAAVKAMRTRIERELGRKVKGGYHIKYGSGGLVDIEFMIQYLQLTVGPENLALLTPDTLSALDTITSLGLLPGGERLKGSYVFLKDLESCLRITSSQAETVLPEDPARLTVIAARMGYGKTAGAGKKLLDDFLTHTGNVRQVYEGFFK
jgi:glutamate-ammonia-ligase adenylyltransferase